MPLPAFLARPRFWRWTWALLLAAGLASAWSSPLNHDVGWFLHATGRLWNGARLYVDVYEINPPMVFHVMTGPVAVAEWLGVAHAQVFSVFVLLLGALCAALTFDAMRGPDIPPAVRHGFLAVLIYVFLLFQPGEFGQREHLTLMLVTPYLIGASLRMGAGRQPRSRRLLAGVLAGIGLGLKPYFALPFLLVEGHLCLQARSLRSLLRVEAIAICAVNALYIADTLLRHQSYFDNVLPMALAQYWAYDDSLDQIVAMKGVLLTAGAGALAFAAAGWYLDGPWCRAVRVVLVASLGFAVAYMVQQKAWPYHFMPAIGLALLATTLGVLSRLQDGARVTLRLAAGTVLFLALPVAVAHDNYRYHAWRFRSDSARELYAGLLTRVQQHASDRPLFILSTSLYPAFPLANESAARWPYRYNCLWPLPGFYRGDLAANGRVSPRPPAQQSKLERRFASAVVDDLIANPPAVLGVHAWPDKQGFAGAPFDILEYFQLDPRFLSLWRQYEPIPGPGMIDLYRRTDGARRDDPSASR